jgi:hypothetical protein
MKVIEAKEGKKFKPGDFVYVSPVCRPSQFGMIIRYFGKIDASQTKEEQEVEVYEVLIGKKMRFINEELITPLNEMVINKIKPIKN